MHLGVCPAPNRLQTPGVPQQLHLLRYQHLLSNFLVLKPTLKIKRLLCVCSRSPDKATLRAGVSLRTLPIRLTSGGPHCTSGEDALQRGRGRDRNQLCCLVSRAVCPGGKGWARWLSATEATWCGGPARATLSLGFTVGPSGGPEAHSELNLRPALWRPRWVHLQPVAKPEHISSPRVSPVSLSGPTGSS